MGEKQKTLGPKSSAIWDLWRHLTFKIDLHPPGTPKPSKNQFCWSKNVFLEGFGVPGGCKSILNVNCLHKFYIAELFGPRVFCFSVGRIFFFGWKKSCVIAPPPPFFLNIFLDKGVAIKVGIEVLKVFLRSGQNHRFCCNRIKILTHRKTKTPRSKKFRHIKFMETFNI